MSDTVDVLIIGGGAAGVAAAQELRDLGFDGSVLLVTREAEEPYERPPVTKGLLQGASTIAQARLVPPTWWRDNSIELRTRAPVMAMNTTTRTITLASKATIQFKHALVATGAMVRRLQVDGGQLDGIHYLRTPGNAATLRAELETARHVAVVGGSYIACEVAASLASLGVQCTIIMQEQRPLERGFGRQLGAFVAELLEEHGVALIASANVSAFDGDGRVQGVATAEGVHVEADAVVVGVGAVPDVMLARKAGLTIGQSGGVACDAYLQSSVPGIYAAGDMCEYQSLLHGRAVRIEHHEHAAAQGRTVARNLAGPSPVPHRDVPYFWTDLADWAKLEYVGVSTDWDEEQLDGSLDDGRFVVRYLSAGRLVGAAACNSPGALAEVGEQLAAAAPHPEQLSR